MGLQAAIPEPEQYAAGLALAALLGACLLCRST